MQPPRSLVGILPTYWPAIHEAVSASLRKGWGHEKPSLLANLDPLQDALGSGLWGAVYQATPRKWVVKITTDEREAIAYHDICVRYGKTGLRSHAGVVYFADAWHLADQARVWEYGSYSNYTVYVLLREAITPLRRAVDKATYLRTGTALQPVVDAAITYDHALEKGPGYERQLDTYKSDLQLKIAAVKRLRHELWPVGEFMGYYLNTTGFALADVHVDNIGRKAGAKHWSIFDLGHPVTTSVRLVDGKVEHTQRHGPHAEKPLFKELKP
jgi:hypothetical protein